MASPRSTCSSQTEYVCSHEGCYMVFTRPSRLECHVRIHTGERPYVCSIEGCHKSYTRSSHLKRHLEASHADISNKETFKCSHSGCDKEFGLIQNMKKHFISAHQTEGLKYKCSVSQCNEKFRKKHQLRDHLQKHEGVTYLSCPKEGCVKQFAQKSHLQRHLKQHDGYYCNEDECSERFDKFTLLRKHIAVAHKNWYSCTECGKQFARKLFLQAHLRTHTGVMVACTYEGCPRAYYDIKNLNSHIRSYHEGKKFECHEKDCGRKFSTKQKLAQHIPLHDPTRPLPKKKPRKSSRKKSIATRLTGVNNQSVQPCQVQSESESEPLPLDSSLGPFIKQPNPPCSSDSTEDMLKGTENSNSTMSGMSGSKVTTESDQLNESTENCQGNSCDDHMIDNETDNTGDSRNNLVVSNVLENDQSKRKIKDLQTVSKIGVVKVC